MRSFSWKKRAPGRAMLSLLSIAVVLTVTSCAHNDGSLYELALKGESRRGAVRLIEEGANVNEVNAANGQTPLHAAARKNHDKMVAVLLEHGANPNAQDLSGTTPLHIASENGHKKMVAQMLEHGGDPNVQDQNGFTPLHMAMARRHQDTAGVLLSRGADPTIKNSMGLTPADLRQSRGDR